MDLKVKFIDDNNTDTSDEEREIAFSEVQQRTSTDLPPANQKSRQLRMDKMNFFTSNAVLDVGEDGLGDIEEKGLDNVGQGTNAEPCQGIVNSPLNEKAENVKEPPENFSSFVSEKGDVVLEVNVQTARKLMQEHEVPYEEEEKESKKGTDKSANQIRGFGYLNGLFGGHFDSVAKVVLPEETLDKESQGPSRQKSSPLRADAMSRVSVKSGNPPAEGAPPKKKKRGRPSGSENKSKKNQPGGSTNAKRTKKRTRRRRDVREEVTRFSDVVRCAVVLYYFPRFEGIPEQSKSDVEALAKLSQQFVNISEALAERYVKAIVENVKLNGGGEAHLISELLQALCENVEIHTYKPKKVVGENVRCPWTGKLIGRSADDNTIPVTKCTGIGICHPDTNTDTYFIMETEAANIILLAHYIFWVTEYVNSLIQKLLPDVESEAIAKAEEMGDSLESPSSWQDAWERTVGTQLAKKAVHSWPKSNKNGNDFTKEIIILRDRFDIGLRILEKMEDFVLDAFSKLNDEAIMK